jgi:hypothetical protein
MVPMATTIAGDEPEMTAKNMHNRTEVIARPPEKPLTRAIDLQSLGTALFTPDS